MDKALNFFFKRIPFRIRPKTRLPTGFILRFNNITELLKGLTKTPLLREDLNLVLINKAKHISFRLTLIFRPRPRRKLKTETTSKSPK